MSDNRRKELAEKLMSVKKTVGLSASEKKEIYKFLTGEMPPSSRKGAPSTIERDKGLALQNLFIKYETGKFDVKALEIAIAERGAYRALAKGVDALKKESADNLVILPNLIKKLEEMLDKLGTELIHYPERARITNRIVTAKKMGKFHDDLIRLIEYCRNK